MKKICLVLLVLVVSSIAYSETKTEVVKLSGSIIDNTCAVENKDNLQNYVQNNTKATVLTPTCSSSGFSLYSGGKLYAFDKSSNEMILKFLNKRKSKLDVVVKARQQGGALHLLSIKNQKK